MGHYLQQTFFHILAYSTIHGNFPIQSHTMENTFIIGESVTFMLHISLGKYQLEGSMFLINCIRLVLVFHITEFENHWCNCTYLYILLFIIKSQDDT
jgi:hypothetical protein